MSVNTVVWSFPQACKPTLMSNSCNEHIRGLIMCPKGLITAILGLLFLVSCNDSQSDPPLLEKQNEGLRIYEVSLDLIRVPNPV